MLKFIHDYYNFPHQTKRKKGDTMSLDGFSMSALVRELADALTGGRIDKINQPNKQSIVLGIRQPGQNLLLYINTNAGNPSAHLIETAPENPAEPPTFVMLLRKQLETGRIAAVRQEGRDRIIHLDIDIIAGGGRIVTRTLTLELIGKYSNIILHEDGIITEALRRIGENTSRLRRKNATSSRQTQRTFSRVSEQRGRKNSFRHLSAPSSASAPSRQKKRPFSPDSRQTSLSLSWTMRTSPRSQMHWPNCAHGWKSPPHPCALTKTAKSRRWRRSRSALCRKRLSSPIPRSVLS